MNRRIGLEYLLERNGNIVPADFEPAAEILEFLRNDTRYACDIFFFCKYIVESLSTIVSGSVGFLWLEREAWVVNYSRTWH